MGQLIRDERRQFCDNRLDGTCTRSPHIQDTQEFVVHLDWRYDDPLCGRERRIVRTKDAEVRVDWFIRGMQKNVNLTMKQRVKVAVAFLKDRVVRNISRAVTKGTGPRGGRVVTGRSQPGEFPKADTTQLMKSIFGDVRIVAGNVDGFVGTPLDYGLILETKLDRSFLQRTLREERQRITSILTRPIR